MSLHSANSFIPQWGVQAYEQLVHAHCSLLTVSPDVCSLVLVAADRDVHEPQHFQNPSAAGNITNKQFATLLHTRPNNHLMQMYEANSC